MMTANDVAKPRLVPLEGETIAGEVATLRALDRERAKLNDVAEPRPVPLDGVAPLADEVATLRALDRERAKSKAEAIKSLEPELDADAAGRDFEGVFLLPSSLSRSFSLHLQLDRRRRFGERNFSPN